MARIVSTRLAAAAGALALASPIMVMVVAGAGAAGAQTYGQTYTYAAPGAYGQVRYQSSTRYDHSRYRGYGRNYGDATGYSYGYVGVGSPLSEVETQAYVNTGRYADGYSYGRAEYDGYGYRYGGYSPSHGYGSVETYGRPDNTDRGGRYGYSHERRYDDRYGRRDHDRYDRGREPGYRDWYGYNDDRPPVHHDGYRRDRRDRDGYRCECASDVYYYDR